MYKFTVITTKTPEDGLHTEYYLDGQKTRFLIQTDRLTLTNLRKYNSAKL